MFKTATKAISSALLVLFSSSSLAASERAMEAWQRIQNGAIIVDVRTPGEYQQSHLENAINIPLNKVLSGFDEIDKATSIVLYCRSGNRSGQAFNLLNQQGFTNLYNGGGINELLSAKPN